MKSFLLTVWHLCKENPKRGTSSREMFPEWSREIAVRKPVEVQKAIDTLTKWEGIRIPKSQTIPESNPSSDWHDKIKISLSFENQTGFSQAGCATRHARQHCQTLSAILPNNITRQKLNKSNLTTQEQINN